ncbi:MAG: HNH endonuclease [Rhodanobacter sp.]
MAERKYTPTPVSSTCMHCAQRFTYEHSTGMKRRHCSNACRASWKIETQRARRARCPGCSVPGCNGRATRVGAGICEKHYGRVRRRAPVEGKVPTYRYQTAAGYISLLKPQHPLSMADGRVYEHRVVAHDRHGGHCPGCHWCGAGLTWVEAVVDHLDEDRGNNSPDNLVVSCNDCNRARGAMLPFVARLTPTALSHLIELIARHHCAGR